MPSCSEPAIGCPPMKRGSPTASTIDAFTLPTSVTMPRLVASACLGGVGHRPHRRGEERDLGVGIGADRVERAELERPRRDGGIAVVAGDVPAPAPERQARSTRRSARCRPPRPVDAAAINPGRSSRRPTAPSRYTWCRSARLRSVVRCISTRMHRGVPPSTSSSRAQMSGTSPRPILRAPVAGKVEWRSSVAVKRMLTMSSWSTSLRAHISSSSVITRSWTWLSSSSSTVVAPRRARRAAGTRVDVTWGPSRQPHALAPAPRPG